MENIDLKDLENYDFPMNEKFTLNVSVNNNNYKFQILLKYNTDKIICISEECGEADFDGSKIIYTNDLSLIADEDYYLKNISDVIVKIADRLNLSGENLFFYGKSSDAFTSLQLASMIKNSTAVLDSPVFFIQDNIENALNLNQKYSYRFDALEMMVKNDYIPKAVILQDDLNSQFLEFFEKLKHISHISNRNPVKIILNAGSPESEDTVKLLNGITSGSMLNYIGDESDLIKENTLLKKENDELKEVLVKWGDDASKSIEQMKDKEKIIKDMLNSRSWKITRPLRKISYLFKKH